VPRPAAADGRPTAGKRAAGKRAAKQPTKKQAATTKKQPTKKSTKKQAAAKQAAAKQATQKQTAKKQATTKAPGRKAPGRKASRKAEPKTSPGRGPSRRGREAGPLTVAVTGPTGTFGAGLMPLLEADPRIGRVIGIARRPFDPATHGWSKLSYRRGDVRDPVVLRDAFEGVDAVVHLAFVITGNASRETIREINVGGTLNAFRAAAASGARRFVYASSVAAYGFHSDNPVGMTEDWPVRPADRLFYAQEKAELEKALAAEAAQHPDLALYLLRPSVVVGPNVLGGKNLLPGFLEPLNRFVPERPRRLPLPVVLPVPQLTLQLVHEADVGQALLRCALGDGPPGAYNIAGDGTVTAADVARVLGIVPLPLPPGPARSVARLVSRLPFLPPAVEWTEAASHPSIMDTTRARTRLGWTPRYTGLEALRDTVAG
jgi:nucleoside-diphosphate-sugar epimerase